MYHPDNHPIPLGIAEFRMQSHLFPKEAEKIGVLRGEVS